MLDDKFNETLSTSKPEDAIYFSKLSILEYCGWIEEAFDLIIKRSVKGKLKTLVFRQMLDNSVIGKTYGFQYKQHFRPMLSKAVGLENAEIIEKHLIDEGKLEILISEMESIKEYRNIAAHTWINGITRTYPTPSYIKTKFETVYPIMKNLYSKVIEL